MHELSHRAKHPQLRFAIAASPSLLLSPSGAALMERSNSQGSSQRARPRRQPPPPPSPQARVARAVRAKRVVPSASGRRESSREPRHPRSAAQTTRPRPQRSECRIPEVACALFPSASRAARLATRHPVPRSISRSSKPHSSKGLPPSASTCATRRKMLIISPFAP